MAPSKTAALKPPTSPVGYVGEEVWFHQVWAAVDEALVPELMWPASVWTFGQMRRDAQLAAVLAAYTLPIRRATWALRPDGCKPAVVAAVADDLGMPVLGKDKPGAARVRGVSWPEHVRTALLHLVYGHMGFELDATVNDAGQARLTSLSERLPHTITEMSVSRNGDLEGIYQNAMPDETENPQIEATRLLWYAHDREGAAYQGVSLLRPAYAAWLLKREMMRVHATSNRRFGMGVPTVTWAPGTNPTPDQHAGAAVVAERARAGEVAGAALPPGAVLNLVGLSGGVPDTMAFMKWLDQQMSRMVLAQFLDLGETTHGSRSLGSEFIDVFMLGLQAIAEYMADQVTRQVAARIVEWNWGPDEPVPTVVVEDVGSKHEVTATAIQALLAAGGITPDPALDDYLRKSWSLPARTIPWTPPKLPAQPAGAPGGSGGPTPPGGQPEGGQPPADGADQGGGGNSPAARQSDLDWGLYGGSGA